MHIETTHQRVNFQMPFRVSVRVPLTLACDQRKRMRPAFRCRSPRGIRAEVLVHATKLVGLVCVLICPVWRGWGYVMARDLQAIAL
jgi:hypothetical protein